MSCMSIQQIRQLCQAFFDFLFMHFMPLEEAAMCFTDIEDRYESVGVDAGDGIAYLGDLQARHDAVEDHRLFPLVSAFAVDEGHGAAHIPGQAVGHFFVLARDDEHPLHFIEAVGDDVDHLIGDEVCHQGIHGTVPGKDKARTAQDEEVEEHDRLADGKRRAPVGDDGQDFRPVQGTAPADDEAHAEADDDAAVNGRQERIRRDPFVMDERAPPGQAEDGKERRYGEKGTYLLIAKDKERNVQDDDEHTETDACHLRCHKGNADDAAVDDVVRDQEDVQADGVDESAKGQAQGTQDVFHIFSPRCFAK